MKILRNKRVINLFVGIALTSAMTVNAGAYNYQYTSGADSKTTFGHSTSTDAPISKDSSITNVRRNKHVTDFPPSYGVFSGEFETEATNPYIDKQYDEESFSAWGRGISVDLPGDFLASTSTLSVTYYSMSAADKSSITAVNTAPSYRTDGSIGTLSVPSFNKSIKIFEDTTVENMRMGLGHFTYTSAWDGNVAFAGHNRGNYAYFSFLKDLKKGDKITYSTDYGTRKYAVSGIYKISVDDTSYLGWSDSNQLTMITCIADQPQFRLCVVCDEVIS